MPSGLILSERKPNTILKQRVKLHFNQGETDSVEIKREPDRDVAYHPYYLIYMESV